MGMRDVDVRSPDGSPEARAGPTRSEDQSLLAQLDGFLGPRYISFVAALALVPVLLLVLAASSPGAPEGVSQPLPFH